MEENKIKRRVNPSTFWPPAILSLIMLLVGTFFPEQFGVAVGYAMSWVTTYFGWFYALGTTLLIVFCIWLCTSKYGKIRFGGKDAKPEMSFWKWFSIVLTSGMAAGICYWCVAEPVTFFMSPPSFNGMEGGSAAAAEASLRYVLMHWTLHPYAVYVTAGVGIAFMYWNCRKPFSIASCLYPLFGERVIGKMRYWINALCVLCIVIGLGTTLGLGIDQMTVGFEYITGIQADPNVVALVVCLGFASIAILAACTGLHKGISMISSLNMYLFIFLLVYAFAFSGETMFILNNTVTGIGQYLQNVVGQAFYLEPAYQTGWVNGWTVFYWAWWIAFAPLIGLFQVKLSKGRTVREYIVVNMFAPCIFIGLWMGVFGSSSIAMELAGNTNITDTMATLGSSVAFFAYIENLPLSGIIMPLGVIAIIFSIVTQTEAEILTIADVCVATDEELAKSDNFAPPHIKIFWGLMMSLIAFVLLYSGGLSAVQTASIVMGLPMLMLLLIMAVATIKGFRNYKEYDKTLAPGEDYD
ncbi:BCCT family transporter [Bengtsoniella intestinalis]|uniref:BCCT family transporter n=1 Tax=Bengtsoniella intestinalis TaxID=3073143 RepID=UPI00391EE644